MISLDTPYEPLPAFRATHGPKNATVAIVGEAWGEEEAKIQAPFIGYSGQELTKLLAEAGLRRGQCFLTNVFAFRPRDNKLDGLLVGRGLTGDAYPMPEFSRGKFIHPKFLPEIERLREELSTVSPNLVIACGATACWALLGTSRITGLRGTVAESSLIPGLKVLPTFHPAFVLRSWENRPIVVADLLKAAREAEFPEIRRPQRWALVNPTIREVRDFFYDASGRLRPVPIYSTDIETKKRQISMVGFGISPTHSATIPFISAHSPDRSYWPYEEELIAWGIVKDILESPTPKLFQNGLYDLQYLARVGIRPQACYEDTMLLHHALYPEMQKGLGFLGSIYTNEPAWKLMRTQHNEKKGVKADE